MILLYKTERIACLMNATADIFYRDYYTHYELWFTGRGGIKEGFFIKFGGRISSINKVLSND